MLLIKKCSKIYLAPRPLHYLEASDALAVWHHFFSNISLWTIVKLLWISMDLVMPWKYNYIPSYHAIITIFQLAISLFYFIYFQYFISFSFNVSTLFFIFLLILITMTKHFSNTFLLKNRVTALEKYGSSHVMET